MSEVTRLLDAVATGDRRTAAELLSLVYDELRKLAAARMASEAPGHTLDATALIHEAYLRLVGPTDDHRWDGRGLVKPIFRSHGRTWKLRLPWGWNAGDPGPVETNLKPDPAELRNTEVEPICKKYLELRYQLLPYNYTLAREAFDTGLPLMRALWLHHPGDPEAVRRPVPVGPRPARRPGSREGATERTQYLPEGDWYDFWTSEKQAGKREVTRKVDLATLPLYVRAGAVLPLDPVRQYTAQPADGPTTIRVYPGRDGEFRLYEDDGLSLDYTRGKFTRTRLRWDDKAHRLTIEPDGEAGLPLGERTFVVEVVTGGKPRAVKYAGKRVEVSF